MLLFFCCLLISSVFAACPDGTVYNPNFNKCYKFEPTATAFLVAEEKCIAMGGHLTSIGNAFENQFIQSTAKNTFGNSADFWIGANLLMSPRWSWSDNLQFSYTNWAGGQPNQAYECASEQIQEGRWKSASCGLAKPYVCEVAMGGGVTARPDYCESGWTFYDQTDSCYKVFYEGTFDGAQSLCQYYSANLASIHNQNENDFVTGLAMTNEKQSWDNQVWIGMRKDAFGDVYWIDNSPVDYMNWGPGQPNKASEQCVELCADEISNIGYSGFQSKWNDITCSDTLRALVCKKAALH